MNKEKFQPISVKPPSSNPVMFSIRCALDLQLGTIAKYLRPTIAELPAGKIIDIGAGESPWREWLPANCSYLGIDIKNSDEFGMSSRGNDIVLYDGGEMPFPDKQFDGAICIEVLEHAENPEKLISEISRILKHGSPLLLSVPWSARRHHIPHDYHRFTRERLQHILRQYSFFDVKIYERGNDISVIANKLIVVTARTIKTISITNVIFQVPLLILYASLSTIMLLFAHISMATNHGSKEDPLGYFCEAIKKEN